MVCAGNEVTGREVVAHLGEVLARGYGRQGRITRILHTIEVPHNLFETGCVGLWPLATPGHPWPLATPGHPWPPLVKRKYGNFIFRNPVPSRSIRTTA